MPLPAILISAACLSPKTGDYRGCGRAWAAVKNGEVVALRYMGEHRANIDSLPAWVRAVVAIPCTRGSVGLRKVAEAASACADCPKPPRRSRFRPSELLFQAKTIVAENDKASFGVYRDNCRAELGAIGEVVSGMCSCCEFVPGWK